MKISSTGQMREMDRRAIEEYGISDELLMENAGLAVFQVLIRRFGARGVKYLVLCGSGNNGGDGLVVARKLHSAGAEVKVLFMSDPAKYRGAALSNYRILSKLPVEVITQSPVEEARGEIARADVLVDALFGTGLARDVEGVYAGVIQAVNGSGKKIVSIDIPSGIHGDSGRVMGVAVRADCTVTFGTPKLGNILYPGYAHCGSLYVSHISFPYALSHSDSVEVEINLPPPLPARDPAGHKGSFGDVLFVAGAANYYGAPFFSAFSFLKSGGGYARLAAPRSVTPYIAAGGSEIVFVPQEETAQGSISRGSLEPLLRLSEQVDMVVAGPGVSLNPETQDLLRQLAASVRKPLLIDGDGITACAADLSILEKRDHPTILTPHPGEMSRLAGVGVADLLENRIELLQRFCRRLSSTIVLKGAHTLIGYPDGRVFVNMSGNAGMATAGSGDTLNGAIAAMAGLGMDVGDAVRTGVFIHGLSGDIAAERKGEDGITARDILDFLPTAVKEYRCDRDRLLRDFYAGIVLV
jgi:hydroxyethylthiazole kinase-like uncharacterized protein yjeF